MLGLLGVAWYLSENERCAHGYRRREGCEDCRLQYVYQKNRIYATGFVYALIKSFFSIIGELLLMTIFLGFAWFVLFIITGFIFSFDNPLLLQFTLYAIGIIFALWSLQVIYSEIKQIKNRNRIYFNNNGIRELVPQAKNISVFSGKKYIGQYPSIYYLKP